MPYNPQIHHRRSIRLKGYDYTQAGAYFLTFCVQNRECIFGTVANGAVHLSEEGRIVVACWSALPSHFPNVELDAFVVMPNHIHAILLITHQADGATTRVTQAPGRAAAAARSPATPPNGTVPGSLGAIVQNFKSVSTRRMNRHRATPGGALWQRNYHEHIIRNEASLYSLRRYVANNPARWEMDRLHPANLSGRRDRKMPRTVNTRQSRRLPERRETNARRGMGYILRGRSSSQTPLCR